MLGHWSSAYKYFKSLNKFNFFFRASRFSYYSSFYLGFVKRAYLKPAHIENLISFNIKKTYFSGINNETIPTILKLGLGSSLVFEDWSEIYKHDAFFSTSWFVAGNAHLNNSLSCEDFNPLSALSLILFKIFKMVLRLITLYYSLLVKYLFRAVFLHLK